MPVTGAMDRSRVAEHLVGSSLDEKTYHDAEVNQNMSHASFLGVASIGEGTTQQAAADGNAATDIYGNTVIEFDVDAEKRLRWKIDLYIVPTVSLLYLFCYIDRANIGNARLAGLEKDLDLGPNGFNTILSIFFISYIVFEIPSNMACKYFGPGWFLPAITLCFGIISLATAFVHSFASACGTRFLLGVFEAGMLPGIAYYLSRWYRRSELTFRLSLYTVMAPLAGAFGGLLASAILTLDHFGSLHRWRMIFAIEGIITIGLSVIAFFTLTDRPETARWLSQAEKDLAIARLKSERVSTTNVLDKIDTPRVIRGVFSPVTLTVATIFLFNNITAGGVAFFAPTIVRSLYPTSSVVSQQLHTVPPYIVGAFFTVCIPFLSWKLDKRNIFMIFSAPFSMIGYIMFLASKKQHIRYGATFLITSSAFCFGSLTNSQVSANVVSDTARAAAISTNVMIANLGGLVSTWSYLPFDAPDYHIGNGLNLATCGAIVITATGLLFWMKRDNKRREKLDVKEELKGLTQRQIEDLDWRHPGFRWKS